MASSSIKKWSSLPWYQQRQLLLAFPISCLVGTLALFSWLHIKITNSENWVKHTQQVRLEANQLLLHLVDAETQFRGYALTRRPEVSRDFDNSINAIPTSMATLENLVADNPTQAQRLQSLRSRVEARTDNLQENFRLVRSLPTNASQQPDLIARLLRGNQLTEQVRVELGEFLAEEERLQTERDRLLQTQRQMTWVFILVAAFLGVGGSLLVWSILQRMERRLQQSTDRLQTLNRFLQTISECNQTLVRAVDEISLLQQISQILVEAGGYRGAWVGFIEPDAPGSIRPMAQAGLDDHFLASLQTAWTATQQGCSVTDTAIQTSKIQISQDIAQDPINTPCQELFRQYGIATAIALPLTLNEHCFGALTIFASTPHAFDAEQVKLLNELADDLSFGIATLRTREERQQAQEEVIRLNRELEKRVKESETRYQQIVELAQAGVWVVDAAGHTTYINQSISRLLGFTEAEMQGRSVSDFLIDPPQEWMKSLMGTSSLNQVTKGEVRLRTKAGKELWTLISTSPVLDEEGQLLWTAALVTDISDRRTAEKQLRLSSERISLANAELARATRLKDEFLAGMSHELRTPLNAVLGLSEALLEEVYGSLTPKQKQSIQTIEQSGQHLLELINDILDLAKIESGKMDLQLTTCSIRALCETSLSFVRPLAHRKHIQLNLRLVNDPGEILLDERRLRQVLINLLSNAVKFTPDGGRVELCAETHAVDEIVELSVLDTGIGIAQEDASKLFEPFVQLDSSLSRRYEGTGLGLALVRRIVEMHGGSVSLSSTPNQGSCFTVTLPYRSGDATMLSEPLKELDPLALISIKRALIVEDSETAASQITRYLTELGIESIVYPQGEGALETALRHQPDVILLDVLLPNSSGWEVLATLKATQETQAIPVIVISVVDERSQAINLGAADYLLKPITRQALSHSLNKLFSFSPTGNEPAIAKDTNPAQSDQPLILLAEDNETNILTIVDYLQSYGVRVALARNGLEAVDMTQQQHPDLILMDIQMPIMDGLEATRQIHANEAFSHIPIIALTALAMPGDRDRCLSAGAIAYLTKPVSLKQLIKTIAEYIPTLNTKG